LAFVRSNTSRGAATIRATADQLGWPGSVRGTVRDLWAHKDLPRWSGSIEATVEPHGIKMFRIGS